jgi:protoporphyrinogen oxidase
MVHSCADGDVVSEDRVIVIGGGWAGLAAATKLVQGNIPVTLLERNRYLGGRASSTWDSQFGEWLDNGPHLFIGAYKQALELLRVWGSADAVRFDEGSEIPWSYPDGLIRKLKLGNRTRIGSLLGLMRFRGMPFFERVKFIRSLINLTNKSTDSLLNCSVEQYIQKFGIKAGESHRL